MQLTIRWQDQDQSHEMTINDRRPVGIGRARDNAVRLRDPRISRLHATISVKSDKWYLRNVSRSNLVRKGGHRVDSQQEVVLNRGDIFEVGHVTFHALGGPQDPDDVKRQCQRCNHIVEDDAHEFCRWCGLSLSLATPI